MKLKLLPVREAAGEYINTSENVAEMMKEEGKADRELLWVLHLNTKHRVIEKELVSLGTLDSALCHPREVFRKAVINSSSCIITVHNHPSGDPKPSTEDQKWWDTLKQAGEILSIPVLDNIIITPNERFFSEQRGH